MRPGEKPSVRETAAVAERYARRAGLAGRYDPLDPSVYLAVQERDRALIGLLRNAGLPPLADRTALEIGCGIGSNLLDLLRLGFRPANLCGNELLPERVAVARERLPAAVRVLPGDALQLDLPDASFDVVMQSTVFTSILDRDFQQRLARRMWEWVKPGGGVLWYDFVYDNPRNPDVKGVALARVRALFPDGTMRVRRVTLAPPISRFVTRVHPALYWVFNAAPFLRTHVVCWIGKR
jgi:SAM-dependent methyltransferase